MIFRRALQREFAQTAAGVFVALFAILITTVLIRLLGQAAGGRLPPDAVLSLIGLGALAQLPVVLSLSVFIAILLTLSRTYRDSEMVVWFAAGVPLSAFVRPVLAFALPFVLLSAAGTLWLSPWAQQKSGEFQASLDARDDTTRVAPGIFRESASAGRVFFVERGATEVGEKLQNVFVHSEERGRLDIVAAAQGSVHVDARGNRFVVLEDGRRFEGVAGTAEFRILEFDRYTALVDRPRPTGQVARTRAQPTATLLADRNPRNLGELTARIGAPLAGLLLALLAIPLAYVNPRAGRGHNLILAILAYLVYSNAISVFQAWVAQGRVGVAVALLAPHLAVAAIAALMLYRRQVLVPFWRRAR